MASASLSRKFSKKVQRVDCWISDQDGGASDSALLSNPYWQWRFVTRFSDREKMNEPPAMAGRQAPTIP